MIKYTNRAAELRWKNLLFHLYNGKVFDSKLFVLLGLKNGSFSMETGILIRQLE